MKTVELPVEVIEPAPWNSNEMDLAMRSRLRASLHRFGLVAPLVVRRTGNGRYETVGGAHRLNVIKEMGASIAACIVVDADDSEARLLSQALNHVAGRDNPGLRAQVVRDLLNALPEAEVLSVLPDSAESLQALASLGKEDLAAHLEAWEKAQAARLKHLQFQLTESQLDVVDSAIKQALVRIDEADGSSPNRRGNALAVICAAYLRFQEDASD